MAARGRAEERGERGAPAGRVGRSCYGRPSFTPVRFLWQWREGPPSPVSRGGRSGRSSMSGGSSGSRSTAAWARWATRLLAALGSVLAAEAQVQRCGGGPSRRERGGDVVPAEGRRAANAGPQPVAHVLLAGAVPQLRPAGGCLRRLGGGCCGARQQHWRVTVRRTRSSLRLWAVCRSRIPGAGTRA